MPVNWDAVGAKVQELRANAAGALTEIDRLATAANATVAVDIRVILDESKAVAVETLGKAGKTIAEKTLTKDQAKAVLTALKELLLKAQEKLVELVKKLPEPVAEEVRTVFKNSYAKAHTLAEEMYTLLEQ